MLFLSTGKKQLVFRDRSFFYSQYRTKVERLSIVMEWEHPASYFAKKSSEFQPQPDFLSRTQSFTMSFIVHLAFALTRFLVLFCQPHSTFF
jgi:hypothetical protein